MFRCFPRILKILKRAFVGFLSEFFGHFLRKLNVCVSMKVCKDYCVIGQFFFS